MNQEQTISIKKDLVIALIIGEILAWLIFILIKGILLPATYHKIQGILIFLPVFLPFICAICLYLAYLINKKITFIYQVAKFVLVGGLNTLVDWGVLTCLIIAARNLFIINSQDILFSIFSWTIVFYSLYKAISFILASINSYLWNKFWTFARKTKEKTTTEFMQFLVITICGFLINVGIASAVFKWVEPMGSLNTDQWAVLAAVMATVFSMSWNFLGYKFIVFDVKKPEEKMS